MTVMRTRRGLVALVAAALLAGCGGGPTTATLEDLTFDTGSYEGRDVVVTGRVVEFDESDGALQRHLVLEDARNNRVQLEPIEAAEPFIGADAEVTGRFTFDPAVGRILEVEQIREALRDR